MSTFALIKKTLIVIGTCLVSAIALFTGSAVVIGFIGAIQAGEAAKTYGTSLVAATEAVASGTYQDYCFRNKLCGPADPKFEAGREWTAFEAETLPNPQLTPGESLPGVTVKDICPSNWATTHRHVSESVARRVFAEYGRKRGLVRQFDGTEATCCELDHLIPLELGGTNGPRNLWPQYRGLGDAGLKDELENRLHMLVCKGELSLELAQRCIARDWFTCYFAILPVQR